MKSQITGAKLRFEEAIAALAQRQRLVGTARYDDIRSEEHYRAFAVAGAMKADLLADLRRAVQRAVEDGVSIEQFRADFWAVVKKHGWHGWTGEGTADGQAWRTRVIYSTNTRKSHSAGRFAQLTEPSFLAEYPFWQWVHSGLANEPRTQHLAWDGMTLHHSDPFWRTYFPPRIPPDYGCTCRVKAVRRPAQGAKTQPPEGWQASANPGAGSPPDFVAESVRYFVEAKAQKLPAPEGAALREAVAAYQAARQAASDVSPQALADFASAAQEAKGRKIVMYAGPVRSTRQIQDATASPDGAGLDLTGYAIGLDNSGVQHTFARHGSPKKEAQRGQIAITAEDFGVIEKVVNEPDAIRQDGQNAAGREVLLFFKSINGIGYLVAMEVLPGRRVLMLNSMRKKANAWQWQ